MNRSHQYLATLLERVPRWELSTGEHQDAFEKIKTRINRTANLRDELASLYKIRNFADVALGLLWIAERVDRDPSKTESTLEEESFVLSLLKKSFGAAVGAETAGVAPSTEQPFGFDFPQQDTAGESPTAVPPEPVATEWPSETSVGGIAGSSPSSAAGGSEADEKAFSLLFEKFLESVQSGTDERSILSEQLIKRSEVVQGEAGADEEYRVFCGFLIEFLNYVSSNMLYDDIRAMNLLSNVFDPFSQWAKIDAGARMGMLDPPIETLRDFRTLFE